MSIFSVDLPIIKNLFVHIWLILPGSATSEKYNIVVFSSTQISISRFISVEVGHLMVAVWRQSVPITCPFYKLDDTHNTSNSFDKNIKVSRDAMRQR